MSHYKTLPLQDMLFALLICNAGYNKAFKFSSSYISVWVVWVISHKTLHLWVGTCMMRMFRHFTNGDLFLKYLWLSNHGNHVWQTSKTCHWSSHISFCNIYFSLNRVDRSCHFWKVSVTNDSYKCISFSDERSERHTLTLNFVQGPFNPYSI